MDHRDAVSLIKPAGLLAPLCFGGTSGSHWADLGCGGGTFTLALADLLPPGSSIDAIDIHPSIAPQTTRNGVTIHPRTADFTTLEFAAAPQTTGSVNAAAPQVNASANPAGTANVPAPIPDRLWPGHAPLAYHGIIMANALHYVQDQHAFLTRLHAALRSANHGALLLIEYDIDMPVARWVPYPLSFATATRLLRNTGFPRIQKLGTHPSAFGRSELYAALALPEE